MTKRPDNVSLIFADQNFHFLVSPKTSVWYLRVIVMKDCLVTKIEK